MDMPTDEGYALIHELDPENGDQMQEVCARFGLAVYYAQVFEAGIANLIIVSERMQGRHLEDSEVDARFDELWKKTLGGLLTQVRNGQLLGADELDLCQQALTARNRLQHRFWREEIEHTVTTQGRQHLCDEVDEMRHLFQRADDAANRVMLRVGAPGGLTDELVHQAKDDMIAEILRRERTQQPNQRTPLKFNQDGHPPTCWVNVPREGYRAGGAAPPAGDRLADPRPGG